MTDFIQRFHFSDSPVRGEVVQLADTLVAILGRHTYPARVQALLGEAVAAAVLLASTLKFEGSLILQVRGGGPLETLMVACNIHLEARAVAQVAEGWSDQFADMSLSALFGNGQLAITIDPEKGERYQGIVPLGESSLAACLEYYFTQSEQLPTRLWLVAGDDTAAGMLLQVLPGHDDSEDEDIWPRLQQLTDTVKADELLDLPVNELLYRLYHDEQVELHEVNDVCFRCNCSRERTESVLVSLGEAELNDILAEQGSIDITCQFCNQAYSFDAIDVAQMLRGGISEPGRLH